MEDTVADRDPEAIKADIDVARDRLAATVDTLTERAHPQRLVDDVKVTVINFVRQPVVVFVLVGVGMTTAVLTVRRFRNR